MLGGIVNKEKPEMAFLCGALGFLITFFMLRRKGGVWRHLGAFVLGTVVAIIPYGMRIAAIIPPGGAYRSEWLAGLWLFGIAVIVVFQLVAMLITMFMRRSAAAKAVP
jgi:hypothetical protein